MAVHNTSAAKADETTQGTASAAAGGEMGISGADHKAMPHTPTPAQPHRAAVVLSARGTGRATWRAPARDDVKQWRRDPEPVSLGKRGTAAGEAQVARFRDPRFCGKPLAPFPAYVDQPAGQGRLGASFETRPRFGHVRNWFIAHIDLEPGTTVYGTGERAGRLNRKGYKVTCWNTDSFDYHDKLPSLYQSHPWALAVRPDGTAVGAICESTGRVEVDTSQGITFKAQAFEAGLAPAITVIEGASVRDVLGALAALTGTMPMPPRWALQYQQCRWSYEPDGRVREIAKGFRDRKIPCGVIWFDIDYMFGFRCFTFDTDKFPDSRKLNKDLNEQGFRTVYMIDPGLKLDTGYPTYRTGLAADAFVKNEAGEDYVGEVWPGPCVFPDYMNERVRRWWAEQYKEFMSYGIDGVWNDMNEPAVFDRPGKAQPETNWHEADAELGGPGTHLRYRNVYGMQMVKASREGIAAANPHRRPFVLTRSNFLGGHRYAATWTGDNCSDWRHLRWSIPMVLNLGLSGQPFVGPDIGGFAGNADGPLFARWMGIGAMLPFSRGHSVKDSVDHEPWSFGEACEATCRRALERRSRLIPHLYTLFRQSHLDGLPVARAAVFADALDTKLRNAEDLMLLGDDLLVRADILPPTQLPKATESKDGKSGNTQIFAGFEAYSTGPSAVSAHGTAVTPLPGGDGAWRAVEILNPAHTKEHLRGGKHYDPDLPETFVRVGAILPLGPVMQHDEEKPLDPLTLVVAPDEHGRARGVLYEDEGDGFAYENGEYRMVEFVATTDGKGHVTVRAQRLAGNWDLPTRGVEVIVLKPEGKVGTGTFAP